ncbi:beta-N-acetylhexosaminidase [Desulfurivibrio sp. C05AmB]|uniref:beta-N-acetylhexosaminidase n=1 Tax=Desulfurivibrio sp. C05AmB TaxID=3374371 RepID=UPI00376F2E4A
MTISPPEREPGGLLMVGLPGLTIDDSTRELIHHQRINDFILFKRNVADPEQLTRLCAELAQTCRQAGLGPPLIAIDQEGGSVSRLGPPFTQFADARRLAEGPEPEAALRAYARTCAAELGRVGINCNLAPVLDLCPAGQGYYMERRVLGADPAVVARLGVLVIQTMQAHGLAACAKHFPGLGFARLDPHREISALTRSRAELEQDDLPPFQAAAAAGVAAIMTSHTIYPALDPERPATLSPTILTELLREKMGYQGVIVSDDLEMGAISRHHEVAEAALASIQAGADLLLICADHALVRAATARLRAALANGELSARRLQESLARIALLRRGYAGVVG